MPRILHLSDVHFGPPHRPEVSAAVPGLVAERRPDLVVVSGDLTQRAKPYQFQEARRFVDGIAAPTLVVPGNHDVPMYRFWERLFAPYGAYRSHFSAELEPVFSSEEMLVVGVNSAHGLTVDQGRIRRSRLARLEKQFAAAPEGCARIAVIHHLLVPPPSSPSRSVLTNAAETVGALSRAGVEVVLSGHYHEGFLVDLEEYYPGVGAPRLLLAAGTATSDRGRAAEKGKNSCFWMDFSPTSIDVSHLLWNPDSSRFEPHAEHRFARRGTRVPAA